MIEATDAPSIADHRQRELFRTSADPYLVSRVMQLWDQRCDTVEIAKALFNDRSKEPVVCVLLRTGREQRRTSR